MTTANKLRAVQCVEVTRGGEIGDAGRPDGQQRAYSVHSRGGTATVRATEATDRPQLLPLAKDWCAAAMGGPEACVRECGEAYRAAECGADARSMSVRCRLHVKSCGVTSTYCATFKTNKNATHLYGGNTWSLRSVSQSVQLSLSSNTSTLTHPPARAQSDRHTRVTASVQRDRACPLPHG